MSKLRQTKQGATAVESGCTVSMHRSGQRLLWCAEHTAYTMPLQKPSLWLLPRLSLDWFVLSQPLALVRKHLCTIIQERLNRKPHSVSKDSDQLRLTKCRHTVIPTSWPRRLSALPKKEGTILKSRYPQVRTHYSPLQRDAPSHLNVVTCE